jgi:hypothetical protein
MKLKVLSLLGLSLLASCQCDTNFKTYVAAHRLSYDANVLLNQKLIQQNPAISDQDKATFAGKLEAEAAMITEAEKLLGLKK